jgi:hypothetical protein
LIIIFDDLTIKNDSGNQTGRPTANIMTNVASRIKQKRENNINIATTSVNVNNNNTNTNNNSEPSMPSTFNSMGYQTNPTTLEIIKFNSRGLIINLIAIVSLVVLSILYYNFGRTIAIIIYVLFYFVSLLSMYNIGNVLIHRVSFLDKRIEIIKIPFIADDGLNIFCVIYFLACVAVCTVWIIARNQA